MATDIYGQKQGTFRKCDFSGVRAFRTDWNWADLREARMRHGIFEQCDFSRCNLVGCEMEFADFRDCNFAFADITDSPVNRRTLAVGENRGVELINWHRPPTSKPCSTTPRSA
ncbi:pentapeptide repeat-containing protein [Ideonella livida]|uniref:Pentapeptide repeat-containing protein n=1 Tax=Ideonella livida TaxID=2707176 RepID=A0A7C9TLS8_9BURK|nr:pentapeptide repeat-containing protein [Ideonella livida]